MTTRGSAVHEVSRTEIIDHLGALFSHQREVSKQELVDAAEASGARRAVIELLELLPGRNYWDPRQLWVDLPELPIER